MVDNMVDLVDGDLNGAAWRRDNSSNISLIEETFAGCALPMSRGSPLLWVLEQAVPGKWADVVDSSYFLILTDDGKFDSTANSIHHEAFGIRPTDHSCHHEAWYHLDFVDRRNEQPHREEHDRRNLLKDRSVPYPYGKQKRHISDVMSDHSLSS